MNKNLYLYVIAGALALVASTSAVQAQTTVDVGVSAGIGAQLNAQVPPPPRNALKQRIEKVQNQYEDKLQNAENNRDYRNNVMAEAQLRKSTSTPPKMPLRARVMASTSAQMLPPGLAARNASTSETRGRKEARLDAFAAIKARIIEQHTRALANLLQIRERIADRIARAEQAGRNMTTSKAALVTADTKLKIAEDAVKALAGYVPAITASSTVQVSASTTVDLGKPREIAGDAIRAINDARRALQGVIVEIAKNMGLKIGVDGKVTASSTPTVTATATATPEATSTATATPTPTATSTPTATPTPTPSPTPSPTTATTTTN